MQTIKKSIHGKEARKLMMEGVDKLADIVGSTMGARGRNVLIDRGHGAPLVVNDGVTVANEVFFDDRLKDLAAQLIKDAARKTNTLAGDGTTTSTVLARAILKEGWKKVEEGANPVQLRKEIDKACKLVIAELEKLVDKVTTKEQVINIAKVSVQDDELGEKIGTLIFDLGEHAAVSLKPSIEMGVTIKKEAGMRLEGQLVGGIVENQDKWETKLEKPRVLILRDSPEDHELESHWVPFMRQLTEAQQEPNGDIRVTKINVPCLLVVAEKLSRRFIATMNANKEIIKWCWFRPTTADRNMKEIYEDFRCVVGGNMVHEESGHFLAKMKIAEMGKAETATVTRHELVVTVEPSELNCDRFLDRVTAVKGQMTNAEDLVEQEQIRARYANLTGGVAVINYSSATDQDTIELRLRLEDAVNATRSAMQEGYVSGGGVALLNASHSIVSSDDGTEVVRLACSAPIRQIMSNAGYDDIDKKINKLKTGEGYDVLTDKVMDMKEAGIVDPLKVTKLALINACSVAGLLLTSEYAIAEEEDDVDRLRTFLGKK